MDKMGSSWSNGPGSGPEPEILGSGCTTPSCRKAGARGALTGIGHEPVTDTAVMTFMLALDSTYIYGTLNVSMNTDYVDLSMVKFRGVKMTINDPAQILDYSDRPLIVVINHEFSKLKSMVRPRTGPRPRRHDATLTSEIDLILGPGSSRILRAPAADVRARPVIVKFDTDADADTDAQHVQTITV